MLKLDYEKIKDGTRIILPETWHEKVMNFGKIKECDYEFFVEKVIKHKTMKETFYLCKPVNKKQSINIALTEIAIRYLCGQELPDQNIGLSFRDFLPLEDTHILVTSIRNPNEIVPGIFKIEPELVQINENMPEVICLNFKLDYTNGSGFSSIRIYCDGNKKSTWKFLYSTDISCMTEYEQMFQDTMIHKMYVKKSCDKLIAYLEREGAVEHARMLREAALEHDNSKISCEDEMRALARIVNDKSCLKDSKKQLSKIKQDSIKLHWKHNEHHPEHYKTPIDMPTLRRMEMCCDWHARSTQYGTDFLQFVKDRQEDRFHFPNWMFAEIWHYCEVLANEI